MKFAVMLLMAFAVSTVASAGGKWYDGSWFDVECYGCPYLPTDTPGKYRKVKDGEENPGMNAKNEVDEQKADYTANKEAYKLNFNEGSATKAADNSFSTFAEAVIWNNMGYNLITTDGDLTKAAEYLNKAKLILTEATTLPEDTDNEGKNAWNKIENANRAKCLVWVTKNLDWASKKH